MDVYIYNIQHKSKNCQSYNDKQSSTFIDINCSYKKEEDTHNQSVGLLSEF